MARAVQWPGSSAGQEADVGRKMPANVALRVDRSHSMEPIVEIPNALQQLFSIPKNTLDNHCSKMIFSEVRSAENEYENGILKMENEFAGFAKFCRN